MGGPETCGARVVMHPTDRTHLEWAEWEQPSPAHSLFQMVAKEPSRAIGDGTSRTATAVTPPVVRQGQWGVALH